MLSVIVIRNGADIQQILSDWIRRHFAHHLWEHVKTKIGGRPILVLTCSQRWWAKWRRIQSLSICWISAPLRITITLNIHGPDQRNSNQRLEVYRARMIGGVIFDFDGVIADSHAAHMHAWQAFLDSKSKSVSTEELSFVREGAKREEILRHFFGGLTPEQIAR